MMVPQVERHLFGQTKLYDLQYCCWRSSSSPQACRMLVGIGLRLAQTAGIHQRTVRIEVPSVELLVWLDRSISSGLRHPCALQYDDFDVELPLECDDEFWEHPIHPFQQPPGLPSRIAFFNMMIRLHHIISFSLKTLYGLRKVRVFLTADQNAYEERVVADFDSALNTWRVRSRNIVLGVHGGGACGSYCAEVRDAVIWGMIRTQCIQHDMGKYMRIGT
ncbi:hypothetical protein B0H13DRAFT_2109815 [Mycena leptocephala]|nr:hypothetical protein B0H13DRAFT_2109815 [Mycena leptocephala]